MTAASPPSRRAPRRRVAAKPRAAQKTPGFAPLKTERLTLRPFRPADAAALHRLINNFDIARMLELVKFPYDQDLAAHWVTAAIKDLETGAACHLAITGQEGEQEVLVGAVGLTIDRPTRAGRLGYWVGQKYWGHGVAAEAAGRLTKWGLANMEIDRITAAVATDNPASAAVLRRIGFRQTGEGYHHFASRGADHPICCSRPPATTSSAAPRSRQPNPAPNPCCWSPPARWSMSMAACCWPAAPRARKWPACGNSPAVN